VDQMKAGKRVRAGRGSIVKLGMGAGMKATPAMSRGTSLMCVIEESDRRNCHSCVCVCECVLACVWCVCVCVWMQYLCSSWHVRFHT
jgi:hypothetical protein